MAKWTFSNGYLFQIFEAEYLTDLDTNISTCRHFTYCTMYIGFDKVRLRTNYAQEVIIPVI